MAQYTNKDRAELASEAVDHFKWVSDTEDDDETCITDLLADLMHLCRVEKISFMECLRSAESHFEYETKEESK